MALLVGQQTAGTTADFVAASATSVWKFTASASGTLTRVYCRLQAQNPALSVFKLGIYADSAGSPGARLGHAAVDEGDYRFGGLIAATISPGVTIVSGTQYWLALRGVGEQVDFAGSSVASSYSENAGSVDFPDPFGGGNLGGIQIIIWGESDDAPVSNEQNVVTIKIRKRRRRMKGVYRG